MNNINNYEEVLKEKRLSNEVVAILCKEDNMQYVCFKMGNKESIEKYIGESDGKTLAFSSKNYRYWVLANIKADSFLLFRQDNIKGFTDINDDEECIDFAKYLYSVL